MAAALPAKLKTADVQRFATRAAQLEKFRPIVTYWCEYYILQHILQKQLHLADEECSNYAVQLMDKLESFKQANASNDAIVDDVAAKAYMENFALETFSKGDDAQRANKVTRQTADTFQAAATFLDVLGIWGPLDQEAAAKSKFAKFHALRIAKALKAGEDPNATNPVVEEPPKPTQAEEDSVDAEMRDLERQANGGLGDVYRPPTVESAPDSMHPSRPQSTLQQEPFAPPPLPARTPIDTIAPAVPADTDYSVSPIEAVDTGITARQSSIGGGYFPAVPDVMDTNTTQPSTFEVPAAPSQPALQTPFSPSEFYGSTQPPTAPSPGPFGVERPSRPPPEHMSAQPPMIPPTRSSALQPPVTPAAAIIGPPPTVPAPQVGHGPPPGGYRTDDESVLAAQKHAKWAISALNFEDVNTAVKEFRIALHALGAS